MEFGKYSEIWCVDFEFSQPPGEVPVVRCLVAKELKSGRVIRQWFDELSLAPPFSVGEGTLIVAYYASAEMLCFKVLGWEVPANILDLYVEFKCRYNGLHLKAGYGLNGALMNFNIEPVADKQEMRLLASRVGQEYSAVEKEILLDYCQADVEALSKVFEKMRNTVDWPRALIRGRYMACVASMEFTGIPIDIPLLDLLRCNWDQIQEQLIRDVDGKYGVYLGNSFNVKRFELLLIELEVPWPRIPSGRLDLSKEAFKEMVTRFPFFEDLHQLRSTLSEMRNNKLAVGRDGRNRCMLSPFASKTGRNQPSTAKFIFGLSSWMRSLIVPKPGYALAYIDWSQQEFGIAAEKSGDANMKQAYSSGDPYLEFAKLAGAVPAWGTKETHPKERKLFKECILAVQYGMGDLSLAKKIGCSPIEARELIGTHKETFPDYWRWSEGATDHALTECRLFSTMGWQLNLQGEANPRSLANWPVQTNGAEIMRIAAILMIDAGIIVCCPVHDAFLIEAPVDRIDKDVAKARLLMQQAGEIVLNGFKLRTDVDLVKYPDHYHDSRGQPMRNRVMKILDNLK